MRNASGVIRYLQYAIRNVPRRLFVLLLLAFLLRLGLGLFAHFGLPQVGYGSETERAGYLFFDAYNRDRQARDLARSSLPLTQAFDEKFSTDQYGGLLWMSAFVYRYGNESPLTMVFLAALAGALGGWFVFQAVHRLLDLHTAWLVALIFLFYPDSILLGASQMREPFLMTLVAMAFYGITQVHPAQNSRGWGWVVLALMGMLLLSPGIALVTILALTGWVFFGGQSRTLPWQAVAAAALLFLLALLGLAASWETLVSAPGAGPFGVLGSWARETARWNADVLKRSSGIVQLLFESLPRGLVLPFVAGYGILQPVLPAALIEPANPFWQGLGILRAVGWYLLLPFLAYAPFAALFPPSEASRAGVQVTLAQQRWLALLVWGWIVVAAVRGGGDQWDNPRYRLILLVFLAIVAAHAFYAVKTRWFWRIVAVEGIVLLVFTHWYAWRYLKIGFNLGIRNTLLIALGASLLAVAGDWLWQALRRRNTL